MMREDKKPQTYNECDGCHNCAFLFQKCDYEEADTYYCTFNASARPSCMSFAMGDYPTKIRRDEDGYTIAETDARFERRLAQMRQTWDTWKSGREVELWGCCDEISIAAQEKRS